MYTRIKTDKEIESMRVGGKMLADILAMLKTQVVAGISEKELADIARRELKKLGGEAAFYGYQGFPDVICISTNDEVVHGIPGADAIIQEGDIVSLDFGVRYKGMITDAAISVICGNATQQTQDLVKFTEASLYAGLNMIKHGCKTGDIGYGVQQVLDKKGYGIVKDLVGHGVGHAVHEDPNIPNTGRKGAGHELVSGMTIAVEPMATLGKEGVYTDVDGWTVKTKDGSRSAHFEHTVLITDDGFEILTTV